MSSLSPQHRDSVETAEVVLGDDGLEGQRETMVDDSPGEPISRLPTELATACFRLLDLHERFAASHVSRAWRRTALSDGALWSTVKLRGARPWSRDMLETLLARSWPAPFAFEWATYDALPATLLDALAGHVVRLGALVVWSSAQTAVLPHVLPHRAPCLRRLVPGDYTVAAAPADWGPRYVPRLEVLKLEKVLLPEEFQPLEALVSLEIRLVEGSAVPELARVFPRLVRLELGGLSPEALVALGPPPPSCRSVDLGSPLRGLLDYSPFLRACHGMRIPVIKLHSAVSVASSVEEFAQATRGRCRMTMRGEQMLILESAEDDVLREVHSYEPLPLAREVACLVSLRRLHDLALPLKLLLGIHQHSAGLFPALHRLALAVDPDDIPTMRRLAAPPLQMPCLAELALDVENLEYDAADPACEHVRWLAEELPAALPRLLVYAGRSRLETLEIVMVSRRDAVHLAARADLGALRGLAKTLRALDEDTYHREHPSRSDDDDDDD